MRRPGAQSERGLGRAQITVEYDANFKWWEARKKASIWNLWFSEHLCFADTREQAIERGSEILRQKALKETVEVEL